MTPTQHASPAPDPWVVRWLSDLPAGSRMLDFAAGRGRHAVAAAGLGLSATAIDRDAEALAGIAPPVETIHADLERGVWPLTGRQFDAIVVVNYLARARFALLAGALAPGGRLVYSTFAIGNERFGRPRNPDFLLCAGELLDRCRSAGLMVLAYEHGLRRSPDEAVIQRICAVRPVAGMRWPGSIG
ncbi:MAG: class I SAM-dependent methyltransferase [Burkholderiaceae bacterium]